MTRPSDWMPLSEWGDPAPGDPDQVASLGKRLKQTAATIKEQADKLQRLDPQTAWNSDNGRKFAQKADDTGKSLAKIYERYHGTSEAIADYEHPLRTAQDDSLRLLHDLQRDLGAVKPADPEKPATAQPATPDPAAPKPRTASDVSADKAALVREARRKLDGVVATFTGAARAIANRIDRAVDDGNTDSWWDTFKNWVSEHADVIKQISKVAGLIAAACGVLALCVGWIPIVGQAAAAILGAVSLAAGVVALACDVALAVTDNGSWADVAIDVVCLASGGLLRAAGKGIKVIAPAVKAAGAESRAWTATSALIKDGKGASPAFTKAMEAFSKGDDAWKVYAKEMGVSNNAFKRAVTEGFGTKTWQAARREAQSLGAAAKVDKSTLAAEMFNGAFRPIKNIKTEYAGARDAFTAMARRNPDLTLAEAIKADSVAKFGAGPFSPKAIAKGIFGEFTGLSQRGTGFPVLNDARGMSGLPASSSGTAARNLYYGLLGIKTGYGTIDQLNTQIKNASRPFNGWLTGTDLLKTPLKDELEKMFPTPPKQPVYR